MIVFNISADWSLCRENVVHLHIIILCLASKKRRVVADDVLPIMSPVSTGSIFTQSLNTKRQLHSNRCIYGTQE